MRFVNPPMKATPLLASMLLLAAPATAADPEVRNGDFEKGKQFWRGDGKVVVLPEGGKVLELKADDRYNDQVTQDFDMGKAQKLEITMRIRGLDYKGNGLRVSIHQQGGGSMIYNGNVSGDWTNGKWTYNRNSTTDKFQLVLSPFPGSGAIQVDDIKITGSGGK